MRTFYRISAQEVGTVLLRRRKIAKALRWWLRENGFTYHILTFSDSLSGFSVSLIKRQVKN
jgi:hypothetical protein